LLRLIFPWPGGQCYGHLFWQFSSIWRRIFLKPNFAIIFLAVYILSKKRKYFRQ
jgi:hypothetical protein